MCIRDRPTLTHYIQQGRNAAGWAAAATWASSASGAEGFEVVPYSFNQIIKRDEDPGLPIMLYIKVVIIVVAIFLLAYTYWKIRRCVRRLSQVLNAPAPDEKYLYRSVGVQSQTTYNGERFKAYENGFRRAGEVSIDLHEHFEKKNN